MKPCSFTKKERLLKKQDFIDAAKKGKRFSTKNLTIFIKSNDIGIKRFGLSVSRKVGSAVKRNRIKRCLREFFRLNKEIFPASSDISISVKQGYSLSGYNDVKKELTDFLTKIKKND
ncbi:MAG: ribonuclease P protein component [Deltaproteobacteria bacterium]|nr:ribonuclease P protein component [Deltaproteobacteria bacterium]